MAEAILSAIISEVLGRVISLVVGNFHGDRSTEAKLQRICRMLIKIHSVVEEAKDVEKEMIINFLLHEDDLSIRKLDVLSILGDIGAGKTTLVQHACDDSRVRSHFTTILLLNFSNTYKMETHEPSVVQHPKHVIGAEMLEILMTPLHELRQNFFNRRFLIVFEGVDMHSKHMLEELLQSLNCGRQDSKIIVTTNNKNVATIGTVQPINLKFLRCLEYWFFFKALAFPGRDAENPGLLASGKSIAMKLNSPMFGMLRANPKPKFWEVCFSPTKSNKNTLRSWY
uniref:NB-ARC domain-containing protein n=1 Tax=Oryza brachyantha TaxID=4533 RepID=J3ND63_ORYBR